MPIDLARRLSMEGLLSDDEFAAVVARRAAFAEPVPVALEALRIVRAEGIAAMFERMGFAPAQRLAPSAAAVRRLPPGLLRALWALPIGESPLGFVVALADPTDRHALAELAFHLRTAIDPRWAPVDALREAVRLADPPPAGSETRTQPAAAAPPPPDGGEAVLRIPPSALAAEVMELVGKGPRRLATPAYGQPRPGFAPQPARGIGGSDALEHLGARPLATSPGGIGAFRATHAGTASPEGDPALPPPTGTRDSEAPIPLRRRPRTVRRDAAPSRAPHEALYALAELNSAPDRDTVARVVAQGMTTAARRAAFFVVKRGVVQGWDGATLEAQPGAGISREALRNLWIPVTTPSIFRLVNERGGSFVGALTDSTADSILAAALGGRPAIVLVAPVTVRNRVVGFLYADGLTDTTSATHRAEELVGGAAAALERLLSRRRER